MTKQQARTRAKALRAALPMEKIGAAMAQHLFSLPCWQAARTVRAFVSLADEPDTFPILHRALDDGKTLLLPRVTGHGTMDWVQIPDLKLLQRGAYGIWEPPAGLPPASAMDGLALIPCLAVGTDGVRLGRGGGYYDRFLAHAKGDRLLLCPSALILPDIPGEDWDVPFAPCEILTEKGIFV